MKKIHRDIFLILASVAAAFCIYRFSSYIDGSELSKQSNDKLRALNNKYGFVNGESLYETKENPSKILASLLQNNILLGEGTFKNRGIILKLTTKEGDEDMVLLTPSQQIPDDKLEDIAREYESNISEVIYAEPDIAIEPYGFFSSEKSKNKSVKKDANHNLRATVNFGLKDPIPIAIIDSGIDETHPFFKDRIWVNGDEKVDNSDNDKNGYADDVHGFDFVNNSGGVLRDDIGHGTHVTGIIAKQLEGTKVSQFPIMGLKVFDKSADSKLSYAIRAIKYASDEGAKLMNISFGTPTYSKALEDIVNYAYSKGAVLVAAAGNSNSSKPHYPAAFANVIGVGAYDDKGNKITESNYGSWVDIYARGKEIISTIPNNGYGILTGTSQSSPFVTGQVALILNDTPGLTTDKIIEKLKAVNFLTIKAPVTKQ